MQLRNDVAELSRSISGEGKVLSEMGEQLKLMTHAVKHYPGADLNLLKELRAIEIEKQALRRTIYGDGQLSATEKETLPGFASRLGIVEYQLFKSTTNPNAVSAQYIKLCQGRVCSLQGKLESLRHKGESYREGT